ncbi:hypothetical protein CBL_07528 [Carabus blaptoides fortunei]
MNMDWSESNSNSAWLSDGRTVTGECQAITNIVTLPLLFHASLPHPFFPISYDTSVYFLLNKQQIEVLKRETRSMYTNTVTVHAQPLREQIHIQHLIFLVNVTNQLLNGLMECAIK